MPTRSSSCTASTRMRAWGRGGADGDSPGPLAAGRAPPGGPTAAGVFVPPSREDGAGIETAGASDGSAGVGRVLVGG